MLSRSVYFSLAGALALSGAMAGGPVRAQDDTVLRVYMNSARVLKLDRPVSKVIVGNSDVADATVADAQTIVLTGRAFGSTNLVILDSDGAPIVDQQVVVSRNGGAAAVREAA